MVNGVVNPVVKPFPVGANSARTAGIAINESNVNKQTSLINTANGGKRIKRTLKLKGGASDSTITVPTMHVLYPETGSGGQTVNGNITGTTKLGATSASASVYDACLGQGPSCTAAIQKAGRRTKTKGGLKWGCYSGGLKTKHKRQTRHKRKTRQIRKTRHKRKSRQIRKTRHVKK